MDSNGGLLLNLAVTEENDANVNKKKRNSKNNVKVVGGTWKDRRKHSLALQGRNKSNRLQKSSIDNDHAHTSNESRSTGEGTPTSVDKTVPNNESLEGPPLKRQKHMEKHGQFGGKNNTYVSSLFTSVQPSSVLKPTDENEDKPNYQPSNAPLKDASDFFELGINKKLLEYLSEQLRLKTPTKVQRLVIPRIVAEMRDVFIKAQTGSGKTYSFLLPIYQSLMMEEGKIDRSSGLFAIILVPTRELAKQIYGVMELLSRCCHRIVPNFAIGGEKKKSEKARIRKGCNILVATPGRLADHLENTKSLDVSQVRWLVLDEGDRLMELGFEKSISQITDRIIRDSKLLESKTKWQALPSQRTHVLCSATIQSNVKKLGAIVLRDPITVRVDSSTIAELSQVSKESTEGNDAVIALDSDIAVAPDQLKQHVLVVPPKLRLVTLSSVLGLLSKEAKSASEQVSRTMLFFSCSDSVNFHTSIFSRNGSIFRKRKNPETKKPEVIEIPHDSTDYNSPEANDDNESSIFSAPMLSSDTAIFKLHGSMTQQSRSFTLEYFINNNFRKTPFKHLVLFCTDVASRGLDLPNISHVLEYDPPFCLEDHLHRIGRSARVGHEGKASLFLLPGDEEAYVEDKLKHVHPKKGNLVIEDYQEKLKKGFGDSKNEDSGKALGGKWDEHLTTWHLNVERWLLDDKKMHDLAVQAFTSHIRAYTTHLSSEKKYFNVKSIHLGHLAKSFGLRQTPKSLGRSSALSGKKGEDQSKKHKKEDGKQKMLRMAKLALTPSAEFNY